MFSHEPTYLEMILEESAHGTSVEGQQPSDYMSDKQ